MKKLFIILFFAICSLYGEEVDFASLEGEVIATEQHCYSIEKYLSSGFFGAVYKAVDENGTYVAIKFFIKREITKDHYGTMSWPLLDMLKKPSPSKDLYGFDREWEVGSQFDHPNIIKAYDYGALPTVNSNDDPSKFLVLEFVSGTTLGELPDGKYTREEARIMIAQLMDAIKYASAHDMYYIDVHAWNMMVTDDNLLKIVDLGSFCSVDTFAKNTDLYISWYLRSVYLLIKRILKKGGYTREEITEMTADFKPALQRSLEDQAPSLEIYIRTVDEWSTLIKL